MHTESLLNANTAAQRLGELYNRWVLDCVVSSAYAVCWDFLNRPGDYQHVDDEIAGAVTNLQSEYGHDARFPDKETREMMMRPIFGASDGHSNGMDGSTFQTTRMTLLAAVRAFAENTQVGNQGFVHEAVRSAIVPFITHLLGILGASLDQTESRLRAVFDTSASILKHPGILAVFGINGTIDPKWPLESNDPQGAKLIEKITTQLQDLPCGTISTGEFVTDQRIAKKGQSSIIGVLETDTDDDATLDTIIAQLYAWGSDLGLMRTLPSPPTS